jgi:putative restriction endonuclease
MPDRPWTREEVLLTINLYCKLPYRRLRQSTQEVRELAHLINRTPSAISMRCCNYVQFDPVESKRVKGFTRAAELDKSVWAEVSSDWERFAAECEQIEKRARERQPVPLLKENVVTFPNEPSFPIGASKEQIVRVRIGQRFFRQAVLTAYNHRCSVTGIQHDALLVASHIKPWKDSDPKTERTNPRNGLCLSSLYDRAFDAGLMTVDEEYRIIFSSSVLSCAPQEVANVFFRRYEGKQLLLPDRFTPEQQFFEYHRNSIFLR